MRHVLLFIAALFIAGPAVAKDIKHHEAGVQYHLPDAWKSEMEGPMVSTITPCESMFGLFLGVDQSDLEKWIDEMANMLDELDIKNFQGEEPVEGEINGMPALLIAGKGTAEGQPMELGITIVIPPNSTKALILLGLNEPGADKKYEADLNKILASLKPLK